MGFCSFKSPSHCGIHEIQERFRFVIPISIRISVILTLETMAGFVLPGQGRLSGCWRPWRISGRPVRPGQSHSITRGNHSCHNGELQKDYNRGGLRFELCVNRATFELRLPWHFEDFSSKDFVTLRWPLQARDQTRIEKLIVIPAIRGKTWKTCPGAWWTVCLRDVNRNHDGGSLWSRPGKRGVDLHVDWLWKELLTMVILWMIWLV